MSNLKKEALKELERQCQNFREDSGFGEQCRMLITERMKRGIGDYSFVEKYFNAIRDNIKNENKQRNLLNQLNDFIEKENIKLRDK